MQVANFSSIQLNDEANEKDKGCNRKDWQSTLLEVILESPGMMFGCDPGLVPRKSEVLVVRPRNLHFSKHYKTLIFFYILILENYWFRFYYLGTQVPG